MTCQWQFTAYDPHLLSNKYPFEELKQFFAKIDTLPLPEYWVVPTGCCASKEKSKAAQQIDIDYNIALGRFIEEENNRISERGLKWVTTLGRHWFDHNAIRLRTMKLCIKAEDPGHPKFFKLNANPNPLMPSNV